MFQQDLLKGKRILITGGGTGLGKAMARRFIGLGANIYICGRRAEILSATESELKRIGGTNPSYLETPLELSAPCLTTSGKQMPLTP